MKKLVKIIDAVPEDLFTAAATEINNIPWDNVTERHSRNSPAFVSSNAIHLRVHKPPIGSNPKTVEEWSRIIECRDNPWVIKRFPKVMELVDWIYKKVDGEVLGRIMIVKLSERGIVSLHIDPEDYFVHHSRFHVPFKTNPGVVFNGGPGTENEHMPYKTLSRLNNRLPHMLENNSDEYRIHLIVDIQTPGKNEIF